MSAKISLEEIERFMEEFAKKERLTDVKIIACPYWKGVRE
jgi:peroxiredoxin family protein